MPGLKLDKRMPPAEICCPKLKKKKKKKVFPAKSLSQSHQKTEEVEEERMEGK